MVEVLKVFRLLPQDQQRIGIHDLGIPSHGNLLREVDVVPQGPSEFRLVHQVLAMKIEKTRVSDLPLFCFFQIPAALPILADLDFGLGVLGSLPRIGGFAAEMLEFPNCLGDPFCRVVQCPELVVPLGPL